MGLPTPDPETGELTEAEPQLGEDGIVEVGARIERDKTYIHKLVPNHTGTNPHRAAPMKNKLPEAVYAD